MKINDKNLVSFAQSKTPVDREGWLMKRGEVNRAFQKRWFLLKGNLLFYFEKKTDRDPVGAVILEGCTVELAENEELFAFKILFHGSGHRAYVLSAESQEDMEGWMKALACASYDYMKLMVAELQRQLSEITEAERLAKCGNPAPLLAGGQLQGNRSDSCLFVRDGLGPGRRFNPFDRLDDDGTANDSSTDVATSGNLVVHVPQLPKYAFPELHRRYGIKFKKLVEERKRRDEKERGVGILIEL
ncbi:sesquipedalian-1-like [Ornithodoros turicata]|uniref:Putative pleckstrin similarity domain protein n=1 Tax=Ornithodoros turicata TaxID=34597 RepID=A0A2R5LJP6_9ACAR